MRNPTTVILLLSSLFTQGVWAQQTDQIVVDPLTGDYHVTYCCGDEGHDVVTVTLVSAKRVNPGIGSSFKIERDDTVHYRYAVANGKAAPKSIATVWFDPLPDVVSSIPLPKSFGEKKPGGNLVAEHRAASEALDTPSGWQGTLVTSLMGGLRVFWGPPVGRLARADFEGVPAGKRVEGFGFRSNFLPGVGVGHFENDTPVEEWPGEGPGLDSPIHGQLEQIEHSNFVTRLAAVPAISVPSPFSAAPVLTALRRQVQGWPAQNLMDTTTANQVDSLLSSAISTIAAGDTAGGRKALHEIRRLLGHGDEQDHGSEIEDNEQPRQMSQGRSPVHKHSF